MIRAVLLALALAQPREGDATGIDAVIERLDLSAVRVQDALRLLSEESGVNFTASAEAAGKSVTTFLQHVTVRQAVEAIAKSNGLWYRIEPETGLVRIMTSREFEQDLVLFRDQTTRVYTLLYPNAREIALAIKNLYGDRVELSLDEDSRSDDFDELRDRFQRFDLLEQRAQSLGIFAGGGTNTVGSNGLLSGGSDGSSSAFLRSNSAGFTHQPTTKSNEGNSTPNEKPRTELTPEMLGQLQKAVESGGEQGVDSNLLKDLRGAPASIFVTVMRRTHRIVIRSSDRAAVDEIEQLVQQLDVPTPQVLMELKILSIDLADDFQSVFDFKYTGGSDKVSFLAGSTGASIDPSALVYQYVDDHFKTRLELLEDRGRVTTLATPLLLVSNNEVARLFVGEERPIVRNISSQTTISQNVAADSGSATVEIRPIGTTLLLTPNINADRTVTVRVVQETSTVKEKDAEIPVVVNENLVSFPVDVVASRTVNATIVAKDGLSVALGGLIEERVRKDRNGVPWLMDLPGLGFFFRREQDVRQRSELLVVIKPLVLFTAEEGLARSRDAAARLSIHPSAATLGEKQLGTFAPHEAPTGGRDHDSLQDLELLGARGGKR